MNQTKTIVAATLKAVTERLEFLYNEINSLEIYREMLEDQLENPEDWNVLDPDIIDSISVLNEVGVWDVQDALGNGQGYSVVLKALRNFKRKYQDYVQGAKEDEEESNDMEIMMNLLEETESQIVALEAAEKCDESQLNRLKAEAEHLRQRIKVG